MNRQPGKWRDRQDVNVTGSIAHRLSQMTPQERGRYALERVRRRLVEAGMTIEHEREVGEGEATEVDEDRAPSSTVGHRPPQDFVIATVGRWIVFGTAFASRSRLRIKQAIDGVP